MHIAIATSHLGYGGAQRVMINLANELDRRGHQTDLIAVNATGGLKPDVNDGIRLIDLSSAKAHHAVPSLVQYLYRSSPDVLLSSLTHVNLLAIVARSLTFVNRPPLIISEHSLPDTRKIIDQNVRSTAIAPYLYKYADQIVAVSEDIADSVCRMFNVSRGEIFVIPNPVIDGTVESLAGEKPVEVDFDRYQHTVLGVGRLEARKSFQTLIAAHHHLSPEIDLHTIIAGDGPKRSALEREVARRGLEDEITFTGYVDNPYALMSRASVFALSSISEGFPSVLVEALACGCPVVATNCSSAVSTILKNGEYGRIVPTNDYQKFAEAIQNTLFEQTFSSLLQSRANRFSAENVATEYTSLFEQTLPT